MILQSRNHISVASIALFLGGLLWIAAFWFPVFETAEREIAGYWVFVSGWMGFVVFQFAWYANLLILIAVILMYSAPVRATIFAAVGLLIATQAFWFDALPETTQSVAITAKGLGFWFWYAGIFLMSVGVFFCLDSDEVTDVIETPEDDTALAPEPVTVAVADPTDPVNPPPVQSVKPAESAGVMPEPVSDLAVLPEAAHSESEVSLSVAETEPLAAEVSAPMAEPAHSEPEMQPPVAEAGSALSEVSPVVTGVLPPVSEVVDSEVKAEDEVQPEPFVLNKTNEELELTIPVVTSILQDAVFPDIKKPASS